MSQLCGYLEKQNRGGLFASTWVKRWFVVSLDHHLEVYTDSSGPPRDRFPVQSILAVVLCNTNFEFHLKAKHRIYCLRAQSQAECNKWVDGLAAAVAKFKLTQSPELRSVPVSNNQQPLQELKSMEQMPLAPLHANKQDNPRVDPKVRPPAPNAAAPAKPVVMKSATPVKSNDKENNWNDWDSKSPLKSPALKQTQHKHVATQPSVWYQATPATLTTVVADAHWLEDDFDA